MDVLSHDDTLRELSSVSLSEIAIKNAIGKLTMPWESVLTGIADLQIRVIPYGTRHARPLFDLPLHHRDPFDRQIIAHAMAENIPVVTSDPKFSLYKGLSVIW
jgi:PIN domain nuclease of toxin-antitoxin system